MTRFVASLASAVALALSGTVSTPAYGDPAAPQTSASRPGHELTRADLEAWLDGRIEYGIARGEIAGAVVAVVRDGAVLLQKGYGYADVAERKPVDPDRTLFRIGSISKLFTWTAVMQLADQGRIDLDRDVNEYLDFEIPRTFTQPITMRHLMTHTAGFGEQIKGTVAADPADFHPLERYVKKSLPSRISPPGAVPAYSNYGAALAGYIVQRVSGEAFEDYIDRRILRPLRMQHSSARQPLPASLADDMSRGYKNASSAPHYFELIPSPMGGVSASAADMARFMIAHLQAAEGDDRLLSASAVRLLHGPASRPLPAVNGVTLGFAVHRYSPLVIGHGGNTQVFHSDLRLLPDERVGLFVSFNSTGRQRAALGLLKAIADGFIERYFPGTATPRPTIGSALEHGRQLALDGPYRHSRGRADSVFGSLSGLFGQQRIAVHDDGTIVVPSAVGLDGKPRRWREVAPYVWEEVGGVHRMAAHVVNGRVQAIGMDSFAGTGVLLPVPASRSSVWILPLIFGSVSILVLTLIEWPLEALARRRYGIGPARLSEREALARCLARCAALVNLTFLFGWMLVVLSGMNDASRFGSALDPWIRVLHLLAVLGLIGAGAACWYAWLAWRGRQRRWSKLWSIALAAACICIVWFAFSFKLVTISLEY